MSHRALAPLSPACLDQRSGAGSVRRRAFRTLLLAACLPLGGCGKQSTLAGSPDARAGTGGHGGAGSGGVAGGGAPGAGGAGGALPDAAENREDRPASERADAAEDRPAVERPTEDTQRLDAGTECPASVPRLSVYPYTPGACSPAQQQGGVRCT